MRSLLPKLFVAVVFVASVAGAACKESDWSNYPGFGNGKIVSYGVNGNGNISITFAAYPGTGSLPTKDKYLDPNKVLFWIPAGNTYRKDQLTVIQQAIQLGSKVAAVYCTEANSGMDNSNELVNIAITP